MKIKYILFPLLLLILYPYNTFSQPKLPKEAADSLWSVWKDQNQADSNRLEAIKKYAWDGYLYTKPDSAFYYAQLQYNYAEEKGLKKSMAAALNTQGASFHIQSDYTKALEYYTKSLKIIEELGDKKKLAAAFNNIGNLYKAQGNYPKAIDYFNQSLNINKELGNKKEVAKVLNNMGGVYLNQGYMTKAIDYFTKYLKITKELGDKKKLATAFNNIGLIYKNQGDYTKAMSYYTRSIKIKKELGDKNGITASLNSIGIIYENQGDYVKALDYYTKSLKIKEELGNKEGIAMSLGNIGNIYEAQSNYEKAIDYFSQGLKIFKELGNKKWIAVSLDNIGLIYKFQGNYAKAIDYQTRSLKIREEIGDNKGIATSLNNIGIIYENQGNYTKAMDYYNQSSKIFRDFELKYELAATLANIGNIYSKQGDNVKALDYHEKGLGIREKIGDKQGVARSLGGVGDIYTDQGEYIKSLEYYTRSFDIYEEIDDKRGMAISLTQIGNVYQKQGDYFKALNPNTQALKLAQEIGAAMVCEGAAQSLWKINKQLGRHQQSLEMYELYIATRDSIKSEENQKEIIRQEYKYEYEKQAQADSIKAAETKKVTDARIKAQNAQLEQEQTQRYALYGGVGLLFLFGGFMFNRFRVTKKQKGIIEVQKTEVEEKNKEILDSINYAKRLQEAILPPKALVKEWLKESFILYKPKDIIAGDFYWMETVGDTVYFAAADCTGHGVPGAMVSVVCSNALSKSLIEENITEPAKILDRTRELVINRFGKSEAEVKDGMDISLCALNTKTNEIQWAGANNPLWIINPERKSWPKQSKPFRKTEGGAEIKADKQPIGKYASETPFTNHKLKLQKGDALYMFSDGYPDQFGGEKGKKYKSGRMQKTLLAIYSEPMQKQRELLNEEFENWRGEQEQIDDVCIVGVKI